MPFTSLLLDWFVLNGRTNLPWQNPRTPYAVWISEIMLQQTQVKTVIPFFLRFMQRFPDISTLAQASEDEVLAYWSGLGYYSRGRNLQKTALILVKNFNASLPQDINDLMSLPGIGESTAAAIASLAYNQPTAILDGNVKRVLSRFFMVDGLPNKASTRQTLQKLANQCMSRLHCADYTQAIMDFGATVCTPKNPECITCPLNQHCMAYINNAVEKYPEKSIKKALPHKIQLFPLIYSENGKIYLEKRPSTGIWGGLWCFPWLEIDDDIEKYIKTKLGLTTRTSAPLLNLKHTFTHFHLHLHGCAVEVNQSKLAPKNGQFFFPSELKNIGLSKPISTLINYFLNEHALKLQLQQLHPADPL